jgi:glycosyltransferase involved in cell wall biosynthesis
MVDTPEHGPSPAQRLGVYLELPYRRDASGYSTDRAFILFVLALRPHVGELRLIGRLVPGEGRAAYAIPADVGFAPLPHYPSLRDLPRLLRAGPATLRAAWRSLDGLDAVWAIGPHPVSIPVTLFALLRGRRVVLGVRQDFPQYVRHRLPSPRWRAVMPVANALEASFRLLARRLPTVAVGADLARRYAGGRAPVLDLAVSLVREESLAASAGRDLALPPDRPVELLAVGRLDPEKTPEVLLGALERLLADEPGRYRLTFVGTGPLEEALRARAAPLGDAVRFLGYVPQGPELDALYREAGLFVHSARTEGLPQVLIEAQAARLPTVATDVGGVRAGTGGGTAAVLVPPEDPEAYAAAVRLLAGDEALRERLVSAGLELVRPLTLERQARRVAEFIAAPEAARASAP